MWSRKRIAIVVGIIVIAIVVGLAIYCMTLAFEDYWPLEESSKRRRLRTTR